jgi:hypothetical protein
MAAVRVFFCEPTGRSRRWLRRYETGACPLMPGEHSRHDAMNELDDVASDSPAAISGDVWKHDDPRWPQACGCGHVFPDSAEWQLFTRALYRGGGQTFTLADAPIGACWDADWFHDHRPWCGPDGRSLVVRVPGGAEWMIDSRASNCTLPKDDVHKCWVRHGRPEDGTLHVDKNGQTCAAGAGSIQTRNWHGFLHHGVLSEAG